MRVPARFFFGFLWMGLVGGVLCSTCLAQSPYLVGDFPTAAGVVVFNEAGRIQTVYPIPSLPTDLEILPTQSHFAVVTHAGEFLIYSGEGQQVYNANFESLNDIDCVDDEANRFLLTSRAGKRVFFFDRQTSEEQTIPFAFEGPTDADLLPNGNLLVCDSTAGRIVEMTPQGELVQSFEGELKQPMDALRLPRGETMISDFDNHQVLVVAPDGNLIARLGNYNHPTKLTLLANGSVLVADADNQQLQEISPQGDQRIIRKQLNYIQSAVYSPPLKLYLCAIQAKFQPPYAQEKGVSQAVQASSGQGGWISFVGNSFFLIGLAVVLAWISRRWKSDSRWAQGALLACFGLLFGVLYVAQTQAATVAGHRPSLVFWIGALFLSLIVFRDAVASYWPKDQWIDLDAEWRFPWSVRNTVLALLLPILSCMAQYFYRVPLLGWKLPWFIPVIVWGATLVWLYSIVTPKRRSNFKDHSVFQLGPVTVAVPFTTGSVSRDELDDSVDDTRNDVFQYRLFDSWANSILILVLVLGAALYFIGSTSVPTDVHGDEAEVALHGLEIRDSGNWNLFDLSWYEIPNLFYLIPAWVMWVFGDNLFGVRVAGGLIGVACLPIFYLLARRFMQPVPAAIATFLLATSTFFIHFSRIGIGYNQTTLFTVAVLYGFVRGLQEKDIRWLCMAGILSAIGFLSYQATKILLPLCMVSMVLLWITRAISWRGFWKGSVAFLLAFWIGIAPLAGNYLIKTDAVFSRAKSITMLSPEGRELMIRSYPPNISKREFVHYQLERSFLAPLTHHDNSPYLENRANGGMLDAFPAILFMAGVFLLLGMIRHSAAQLLMLWGSSILILGSALTDHAPSYQRLVGLIPLLALIAAPILNGCLVRVTRAFRWMPRTRLHVTSAVLIVLLIFSMHRYFHQIMAKPQMLDEWTRIATYLHKAGPTQYTYFLGPPHVYFKYGTLLFLAPESQGEDVLKPAEFVSQRVIRRGPVCFLLVRNNRRYINDLRRLYPGGREENHFNIEGGAPFTTYVVNF